VVTPTLWRTGAPGLAPYSAAVEGQRLLAKSAARQWGRLGITVNCVAPAWQAMAPGGAGPDQPGDPVSLADAALGPADMEADVGGAVVAVASAESGGLTGATLCLDGGVAMAP
jgi:NAD(P)-dependent dehydrogenase (short-subunit alcohol dehydrogenase family)